MPDVKTRRKPRRLPRRNPLAVCEKCGSDDLRVRKVTNCGTHIDRLVRCAACLHPHHEIDRLPPGP